MPHITRGGVSNQIVDPDLISEPGVPPEKALDEGLTDVGQKGVHIGDEPGHDRHKTEGQDVDRDRQADDEQPKGNDWAENDETAQPQHESTEQSKGSDRAESEHKAVEREQPVDAPRKQAPPAAKKTTPPAKR